MVLWAKKIFYLGEHLMFHNSLAKYSFSLIMFISLSVVLSPAKSLACASCGCTLSSDWEEQSQKAKLDIRYDYVNQSQLRAGTSTISPDAASKLSNNTQEVENYTRNTYVTASAEYSVDPVWKIGLQIPYILRDHSTMGTSSNGVSAGPGGGQYTSYTSSLGDIKLLGRFHGLTSQHNLAAIAGLKLPTGSHTLTGASTDATAPAPVAIDRGLQPGSGTTDVILGLHYTEAMSREWDYFGEIFYQSALNYADQYKPGDGYNLNLGLRYMGFTEAGVTPQAQINSRYVQHDLGFVGVADTISTGGTLIYLSPGVTVAVGSGAEVYAFVQVPLYQNLLGVQLTPTYTASLGARYKF